MNDLYTDRLQFLLEYARFLREEPLSLSGNDSSALLQLERTVADCDRHGQVMDEILEDTVMTPGELKQLETSLNELREIGAKTSLKKEQHALTINKIIKILQKLPKLLPEIQYLEDIEHRAFPDGYDSVKRIGHILDEDIYFDVLELLGDLFNARQEGVASSEKSKAELELVNLARLVGYLEKHLVMNVLYVKPPGLILETKTTSRKLLTVIDPCSHLIKTDYFQGIIQEAVTAFEQLSGTEELRLGRNLKLKGLLRSKKGVGELENLASSLNLID
ncbi:MAG: hypothetical protein ACFFD4_27505 [Candidatus Odinarchaeota archaeon]